MKTPRYGGAVYEVGPLARLAVGYAAGIADVRGIVDGVLTRLGLDRAVLFSTLDRLAARALETQLIARRLPSWVQDLRANLAAGNLDIINLTRSDPATWPAIATGWGTVEALRGALGHSVRIERGRIVSYQMSCPRPGTVPRVTGPGSAARGSRR